MCRFLCRHKFSVPLGKYQETWLMDYMIRVYLHFKKLPNYFPKWLHHFAFRKQCMSVPVFPHLCQYLLSNDFSHSSESEVIPHGFICISLMANDGNHLFMCFFAIFIFSLEKRLLRSFALFLIRLSYWVVGVLCISLSDIWFAIFSLLLLVVFHFHDSVH